MAFRCHELPRMRALFFCTPATRPHGRGGASLYPRVVVTHA